VGVYGKLPCNGDFLRRRVPQDFLDWWDLWLQQGVLASRAQLGEFWLDVFLTSPAWRFHFEQGGNGSRPCAGLLVPSVDRVGRYFPLTVVWFPRGNRTLFSLARRAAPWFEAVERLVVEALQSERLDFETFDRQLADSATLLAALDGPDEYRENTAVHTAAHLRAGRLDAVCECERACDMRYAPRFSEDDRRRHLSRRSLLPGQRDQSATSGFEKPRQGRVVDRAASAVHQSG
jgi:type VI secretion system ImpM family protein